MDVTNDSPVAKGDVRDPRWFQTLSDEDKWREVFRVIEEGRRELEAAPDRAERLAAIKAHERAGKKAYLQLLHHVGFFGVTEPPADKYYVRFDLRPAGNRR